MGVRDRSDDEYYRKRDGRRRDSPSPRVRSGGEDSAVQNKKRKHREAKWESLREMEKDTRNYSDYSSSDSDVGRSRRKRRPRRRSSSSSSRSRSRSPTSGRGRNTSSTREKSSERSYSKKDKTSRPATPQPAPVTESDPTAKKEEMDIDKSGEAYPPLVRTDTSVSASKSTAVGLDNIVDLSSPTQDKLKTITCFNLGSNYFLRVGSVNFFHQGGTFDAITIGRRVIEKEGGKPKDITLNLPIRLSPMLYEGMLRLYQEFKQARREITGQNLLAIRESKAINDGDVDLSSFGAFVAPKQAYRLDQWHVVMGETVHLPKGLQFEAITFIREAKKGVNGKDCKEFRMSIPLRMLPMLVAIAWFARKVSGLDVEAEKKPMVKKEEEGDSLNTDEIDKAIDLAKSPVRGEDFINNSVVAAAS